MMGKDKKPGIGDTIVVDSAALDRLNNLISDWTVDAKRVHRFFLSRPRAEGAFPAILVVHDWWGLNDHVKELCLRLSKERFVAMAPDFYRDQPDAPVNVQRTKQFMNVYTPDEVLDLIRKALADLKTKEFVIPGKIGILGLGRSASYSFLAASRVRGFKASVSFSARMAPEPDDVARLACPALFFVQMTEIEGQEIRVEGTPPNRIYRAPLRVEVMGSFFNEAVPPVFNQEIAKDAWLCAVQFFKLHVLGKKPKKDEEKKTGIFRRFFGILGGRYINPEEEENEGE